jgi:hypothetical protein
MTRAATGDVVTLKPTNNVYTALLGVALLASVLAIVVLFVKAKTLGISLL